jgi:pimeloyl-ACP methyl ester carboxylesterase
MVIGLSLVHSIPTADDDEKVKTRLKSIELIRKGGKSAFINQMIPNLFAAAFKESHPAMVQGQIVEAMKMGDAGMVNFYNAMIARKDTTDVVRSACFPIQWIIGSDDNVIYFKKILEHCYRSHINFVSFYRNCGHMSMIEAPEKLIDDLRMFVEYSYFCNNKPR